MHSSALLAKPRAGTECRRRAYSPGAPAPAYAPSTLRPCGAQRPEALRVGRGPQQQMRPAGAEDHTELVAFLRDAGLEQYAVHFLRGGFGDLETLAAVEDADMKALGIPAFHIVRLRKRLQDLQRHQARGGGGVDPNHPVAAFLEDAGLGQYAKPLIRTGFDDMDTLCDIEEADMKDLGIPRGHVLKLQKRLREFQLQQYEPEDHMYMPDARHVAGPAPVQRLAARRAPAAAAYAMPTEQMKSAVERSWDQVQSLGTFVVAEMLYRHTFSIMPQAIHVFPPHVRMKYREWSVDEVRDESDVFDSPALRKLFSKFINAVGCAVAGLHDDSKLVPMLVQLGGRHANYGVGAAHFTALGQAFNLTLGDILGPDFTLEVERAWTMAYGFMSSIMLDGLRAALPDQHTLAGRQHDGEKGSPSDPSTRQVSDDLSALDASGME